MKNIYALGPRSRVWIKFTMVSTEIALLRNLDTHNGTFYTSLQTVCKPFANRLGQTVCKRFANGLQTSINCPIVIFAHSKLFLQSKFKRRSNAMCKFSSTQMIFSIRNSKGEAMQCVNFADSKLF